MNESKDRLLILKKYRSLSPEARKLVNTETNDRFWTQNEERRNQKIDPNNPADKPFVKEWLQIRDELMSLKDYDWENIASKNREIRQYQQEQGKTIHIDNKTYQPAFVLQDRAKREILGRIKEKIDKAILERKTTEQVSFHIPSVLNMSVAQIKQFEKSMDNLLTATKVATYKDLGTNDLMKTDIYSKILKSLDRGNIPNFQPLTEITNIVKPVLDPATLKALDTTFDQYRQYPENWGILTTRFKVAIGEEKSSDADLVKEAKSKVSHLFQPVESQKLVEKFADDLLQRVRSPNPDTYRYIQKIFDELASVHLDDNVAAAFLRKNSGATDKDLAIMAKSPHGGKELLVRLYDVLTTQNLWAGDKERYAAQKVLMTVTTLQERPKSRVRIFPFSSTFLSGSYVTAKLTKEGNIWVKMNLHIRGDYPLAKLLDNKLFTTGITLRPWETIGIQWVEQGSKSVQWGPALLLLNMHKHSRDALFGNYFTSAMAALTIATLGMSSAAAEATVAKESLTTGAKVLETARKVGTSAVEVADGVALFTFGVGLITKESSNWLIDTFGKNGESLVEAVKEAEKTAAMYGVARLGTGGIKYGWNKIKKSSAYKELKTEDLKKAKEFDEKINQIEIEFNKARTEATGDIPPSEVTRINQPSPDGLIAPADLPGSAPKPNVRIGMSEGPVAQKGELSTMRGELLVKSGPINPSKISLKDVFKVNRLKHTDYPGKLPTPTELQKMEANLSKMDVSKEGLKFKDPTGVNRQHLWGDSKHCEDFLEAMGKPEKFDKISSLPKEMQHQSYNKFIKDSAKDALKKSDTFIYECDYHKLNGDFGGHQVNVEFSSPTGKRIIVSFDKESGQIFNTFDIKRSGEPIGGGKTMDHPTFTFRNREWIKGNDKQWLGSRSEKPIDVVEKKRVDKPQIPAQTEKPEAKLKIRERKDQQKIAEKVDQMGPRFG